MGTLTRITIRPGRAFVEAEKFGAELSVARTATRLDSGRRPYRLELASGVAVQAKTVIIATGAEYRTPNIAKLKRLEGLGVYYAATPLEAIRCEGGEGIIVGGGNSAGQAPVFLAGSARALHVLVQARRLAPTI